MISGLRNKAEESRWRKIKSPLYTDVEESVHKEKSCLLSTLISLLNWQTHKHTQPAAAPSSLQRACWERSCQTSTPVASALFLPQFNTAEPVTALTSLPPRKRPRHQSPSTHANTNIFMMHTLKSTCASNTQTSSATQGVWPPTDVHQQGFWSCFCIPNSVVLTSLSVCSTEKQRNTQITIPPSSSGSIKKCFFFFLKKYGSSNCYTNANESPSKCFNILYSTKIWNIFQLMAE